MVRFNYGNMSNSMEDKKEATLLQTIRAVMWSFFGIRSKEGYDADMHQLSFVKVAIVGILGAAIFVISLILLVSYITK